MIFPGNFKFVTHIFAFLTVLGLFSCQSSIPEHKILSHAESQTLVMLGEISQAQQKNGLTDAVSPRSLDKNGNLNLVKSKDWTSGFFPGILWYLYELTGEEPWMAHARNFTGYIEQEKYNDVTHDMGFKIYCSFGNGLRLTGDPHYREVIIHAARTLTTRFRPVTGCIRSWDHNQDKWDFPVIIDNLMNLELLFAVTKLTGDSVFYRIAVTHANTTMKNHFRPDFSTYHVVDYDTLTGAVVNRHTHQGYSHESTWSRGEAWALYGYTMCYRETRNPKYLEQAENIAAFILNHPRLPEDLVPYWDYDAPGIPDEPRDASAASIAAAALYELSTYSRNQKLYIEKADVMMKNLASGYMAEKGTARGFILLHSTGSAASQSEVDVPLIYSDYYFLEALVRSKRLKKGQPAV